MRHLSVEYINIFVIFIGGSWVNELLLYLNIEQMLWSLVGAVSFTKNDNAVSVLWIIQ